MLKKILIVDDDPTYTEMVAVFLERQGFQASFVSDALAMTARLDGGKIPDLFIVDMQMPGGGGPSAVQKLRARKETASIPILMISGMPAHHQEKWFAGQPRMRFLRKPIELVDILGHVKDMLGEPPPKKP